MTAVRRGAWRCERSASGRSSCEERRGGVKRARSRAASAPERWRAWRRRRERVAVLPSCAVDARRLAAPHWSHTGVGVPLPTDSFQTEMLRCGTFWRTAPWERREARAASVRNVFRAAASQKPHPCPRACRQSALHRFLTDHGGQAQARHTETASMRRYDHAPMVSPLIAVARYPYHAYPVKGKFCDMQSMALPWELTEICH